MNESDGTPTEAGCAATPDDEEAPVLTGLAILLVLVELKRGLACSCGRIAISTSGKSAAVKPIGAHGSACSSGGTIHGSMCALFGGVAVRSLGCGVT